jgi:hypothetical protein
MLFHGHTRAEAMSEELGFKHGPVEIKGGNLKSENIAFNTLAAGEPCRTSILTLYSIVFRMGS